MKGLSPAWARLLAIIVKELWAVLRDPKGRIVLIFPPIIQLVLFSSAATMEVRNVPIGILNRDGGTASAEIIQQIGGSPNFSRLVAVQSDQEMRDLIDEQHVIGVVAFQEGFSRDVAAHRPATVFVALDGRRANAAQIVAGYLGGIASSAGAVLRPELRAGGSTSVRHMFNPNLDFLLFILPAMIATVAGVSSLGVTSQSVAREREMGSFDQLMVSPLRLHEILIGKMTPPLLVGLFNCLIYLVAITEIFGLPLTGSFSAYLLANVLLLIANIGVGMMISSISQTQQQAFLGMFLITIPVNLFSGLTAPVDNMPVLFQYLAQANPQYHATIILEGLFLKAMPMRDVLEHCVPLVLIAIVTLSAASLLFRSRVE